MIKTKNKTKQTRSRGAQEKPPLLLSQINPAAISQSTQNHMKV